MLKKSVSAKLHLSNQFWNLTGLLWVALGSIALVWVSHLTWYDITTWNKDLALVFFGSRAGEDISLGIGMKMIHYFLIGLALLLSGSLTLLRGRIKAAFMHVRLRHISLLRAQPKKEKKEEPLVKQLEKEEKGSLGCPHHFGYLASHPKNTPIPQECLICPKILECMRE